MKPHFYKVNALPGESYTALHLKSRNFGSIWHYHPELELHYTVKGHGMRFIGDNVSSFRPGEVILLGENLPHSWQCQKEYYDEDPQASVEAVVVQFLPDCMGKELFALPEAYLLPRLFEKALPGFFCGLLHYRMISREGRSARAARKYGPYVEKSTLTRRGATG